MERAAFIWRFTQLPDKYPEKVDTAFADSDGFWIYLKRGWGNAADPGTHIIHEDKARDALAQFKQFAKPCQCSDCITGAGWN